MGVWRYGLHKKQESKGTLFMEFFCIKQAKEKKEERRREWKSRTRESVLLLFISKNLTPGILSVIYFILISIIVRTLVSLMVLNLD